jgi:hypothetical protein
MKRFEVNKTYQTRSIGNHDCIISATIIKRTDKTITTYDQMENRVRNFKVKIYNNTEYFMPWGNYSMCPSLSADREVIA